MTRRDFYLGLLSLLDTTIVARLTKEKSLKSHAAARGLIYGSAATYSSLSQDSEFRKRFIQECEILVPENELKWGILRPTPDRFDFRQGDWLAKFAQTHGMLFRGHTLIWHSYLPRWFKNTVNRQNAEHFLIEHIETVVKHYAGQIHSWDVVNEAIDTAQGDAYGLRKTPWLEFLGLDYIDQAFRVAAEADPQAILVYNDYDLDYDTPEHEARRNAVLKLLEHLKSIGTPIHALGIQAHLLGDETRFNPIKLQKFLSDVASMGLKIMITEIDVADNNLPFPYLLRDRIVARAYEQYLVAALDEPAVIAVMTWGLSDRYTWLSGYKPRSDGASVRPLPLDADLKPKLAWHRIAAAFDTARRSVSSVS